MRCQLGRREAGRHSTLPHSAGFNYCYVGHSLTFFFQRPAFSARPTERTWELCVYVCVCACVPYRRVVLSLPGLPSDVASSQTSFCLTETKNPLKSPLPHHQPQHTPQK